jgi:hypothetical protein
MLTPTQLTALRAAVFATPAANALLVAGDYNGLRSYLNTEAAPAYVVWRTSLTRDEVLRNGLDFTQVDNLTVGQARIWDWLFDNSAKSMNPSNVGERDAVTEAWKGTAAKVAVATYVFTRCKRNANEAERMLASGAGTTGTPSTMTFEGLVSEQDAARVVLRDDGTIWTQ